MNFNDDFDFLDVNFHWSTNIPALQCIQYVHFNWYYRVHRLRIRYREWHYIAYRCHKIYCCHYLVGLSFCNGVDDLGL